MSELAGSYVGAELDVNSVNPFGDKPTHGLDSGGSFVVCQCAGVDSEGEPQVCDAGVGPGGCDCVECDFRDLREDGPRYVKQPERLEGYRPWHALRETLIARRLALGLSQAELAAKLGLTQSAISQFESLYTNPKIATVGQYASALKIRLHFHAEEVRLPDQEREFLRRG
jgi:DNA-binding XRE family transcriptional regulator